MVATDLNAGDLGDAGAEVKSGVASGVTRTTFELFLRGMRPS
jgi:hypothetical protein